MSFPKAKNKRFNEIASCAPPPGRYNVKNPDRVKSAFIDTKGERFKVDKEKTSIPGSAYDAGTSFSSGIGTPMKSLFRSTPSLAAPQATESNGKTKKKNHTKLETARSELDLRTKLPFTEVTAFERECERRVKNAEMETHHDIVARVDDILSRVQSMTSCDNDQDALVQYKDRLENEACHLRAVIRSINNEQMEKSEKIRDLKGELFLAQDESQQEKEKLEEQRRRISDLETQIEELTKSEGTLQENIKRMSEKYDTVEKDLEELEKTSDLEIDKLTRELNTTKACLSELQEEHRKLQESNANLVQALSTNQGNQNHYEEQMGEANKDIAILTIELSLVQSSLKATEDDLLIIKQQLTKVIQDKEEVDRELRTVRQHLWETEHSRSKLDTEAKTLQEDMSSLKESHSKHMQSLKKELLSDHERSEAMSEQVQRSTKVNKELLADNTRLTDTVNFVTSLKKEVENQMEELKMHLGDEKERNSTLENELKLASVEFSGLKEQQQLLIERYHSYSKQNEILNRANNTLECHVSELKTENQHLQESVDELVAEVKDTQSANSELMRTENGLLMELSECQLHVQQLTEIHDIKQQHLTDCFTQISTLETELDGVRTEMTETARRACDSETRADSWRADSQMLEQRVNELTQQLCEKQSDVESFSAQVSALEDALRDRGATLRTANNQHDKLLSELEAKTEAWQATESQLQHVMIESEKKNESVASLTAELSTLREQHEQQQNTVTELTTQNNKLTSEMSGLEAELSEVQNRLEENECHVEGLENKVVSLEAGLVDREEELEQLKKMREALRQEVNEATEEFVNLQYNHSQLQTDVKTKNTRLSEMEKQLGVAKEEINKLKSSEKSLADALRDQETFREQHLVVSRQRESFLRVTQLKSRRLEQTHNTEVTRLRQTVAALEEKAREGERYCVMLEASSQEELHTKQQVIDSQAAHLEDFHRSFTKTEKAHKKEIDNLLSQIKNLEVSLQEEQRHRVKTESSRQEELAARQRLVDGQVEHIEHLKQSVCTWQKAFNDLSVKAEPFKEQIEAYQQERSSILRRSKDVEKELGELAQKYASLLGHQNTKQKIKHVEKLKTENLHLKEELTKVREADNRKKREIARLQERLDHFEGKRRLDPSKAFQHGKENHVPRPLTSGGQNMMIGLNPVFNQTCG